MTFFIFRGRRRGKRGECKSSCEI